MSFGIPTRNGLALGLKTTAGLRSGAASGSPTAFPLQTRATLPLTDRAGDQLYTRAV